MAICTPTPTHAPLIELAAAAGKHVFCEKPIDLDPAVAARAVAAAERAGITLQVGFNRRFDPSFRAVRAAIASGEIGTLTMLRIVSRDPSPPPAEYVKSSGGLFRDMTIHDFDMARFLLGEEPVSVTAVGSVLVDPAIGGVPDIDSAAVTLVTASGKIAQISNSRRASYGYDQRIEVHGSTGMVRADNIHESTVELARTAGFERPPLMNFFIERYMPAYYAEVAAFVAAVNDGRPPQPDGESGLQALILAEAAVRSNAERRTVDVSEI